MHGVTTRGRRILVVEDDPDIATMLEHALTREQYVVSVARDGEQGIKQAGHLLPDLVILDLMLPEIGGFEVLKAIKRSEKASSTRVIILTARKDEVDRILGFELGADDFVIKPFSPRELMLRVRSVLQRTRPSSDKKSDEVLRMGPIEVNKALHQATIDGKPLDLTLTEFRLLSEILSASGRVRTRESLLADVWGYDAEVISRTVDTHVRRLRSKMGPAAKWLVTVRGIGYKMQDPASER
jgi:two-component system phosphate regulon response regulator PhoB